MAYKFSERSKKELSTCHDDLVRLFNEVIIHFDCTIIEGHRKKEIQDEYFRTGRSKLKWPESKHNRLLSRAVDVAPCPIDWNNHYQFCYFAGVVKGIASQMGIKIRWGGDFDMNNIPRDTPFFDAVHFELR